MKIPAHYDPLLTMEKLLPEIYRACDFEDPHAIDSFEVSPVDPQTSDSLLATMQYLVTEMNRRPKSSGDRCD